MRDVTQSCVTWLQVHPFIVLILSVTWLNHACDMTHAWGTWLVLTWHDAGSSIYSTVSGCVICVTWLHHEGRDSFVRDMTQVHPFIVLILSVTWLNHACDMTHTRGTWLVHTWHDPFIRDNTSRGTWLVFTWHDSFMSNAPCLRGTWRFHVGRDPFIRDVKQVHPFIVLILSVTWLNHACFFMGDVTHSWGTWPIHKRYDTYTTSWWLKYGVATISRLLEIIGLFCRISSLL